MFEKNQTVTLEITGINNLGAGVGRIDGMVFFVRGAVSGDIVEASVIKVNRSFCVARLLKVTTPSPYRYEGFCPAPEACGGCVYRHVTYEHELEQKRLYVESAFRKAGLPDVKVGDVRTTGVSRGYRNKAQYPFALIGGHVRTGFFAEKTHKVIPCDNCALEPGTFGKICAFVCDFADKAGWSVYDERSGRGLLRHLYLREGKATGQILVCLVIAGDSLPREKQFAGELREAFPAVVGVTVNINKDNTNVVLGKNYRILDGDDAIEDILLGKKFRISPASFYQVNHDGAELLYRIAAEKAALGEGEALIDLYCGIGTIGLSLAKPETRLVGVEIVADAVKCAGRNAAENGYRNASFFCADAGNAGDLLDDALSKTGAGNVTVVVDPPRKGLDESLVRELAGRKIPKIVYVSCNPDTLARDCALFRDLGYTVGTATLVDMFPRAGHVETVILLSRGGIASE